MKKRTNQDVLIDEITKTISHIPKFIDPKIHLMWWREIQSVYYAFMKLLKPVFLSNYSLKKIHEEISEHLVNLQLASNEGFFTVIASYLVYNLKKVHVRSVELELFEAASNMKKYFDFE